MMSVGELELESLDPPSLDILSEAIRCKHNDQFQTLLAQSRNDPFQFQQLDSQGLNPLHVAVMAGNNRALKTLLDNRDELRLDLDIKSKDGQSALQYAQICKNEEAFRLLVTHGCNLSEVMSVKASKPCDREFTAKDGPETGKSSEKHLMYPIIESYYWSIIVYQAAIKKCYVDLTSYMYPQLIIPALVEGKHLTLGEAQRIAEKDDKQAQAIILLSILERKGQQAYHTFLRALKNEKEQRMHEELAQKIIKCCEDEVEYQSFEKHYNVEKDLKQLTTVYVSEQTEERTPENGLDLSNSNRSHLLESGFHSLSPVSNITHSASASGSNRRANHRSPKFSISETHPHSHERTGGSRHKMVLSRRRTSPITGFVTMEKEKRQPLQVTEVTVTSRKEHNSPHVCTRSSGGSACFYASNMPPRPYVPPSTDQTEDNELFDALQQGGTSVLFHIPDEDNEQYYDDVIDKDNAMPVLTMPIASIQSPPIDIPSSNSSSSVASQTSSRKLSTSSVLDSESQLHDELPPLTATLPSSPPKDLSAIPPARRPLRERLQSWLLKAFVEHDRNAGVIGCKVI